MLLAGCGNRFESATRIEHSLTSASSVTLYETNCSACHGNLTVSTKKDKSAAEIQNAINTNPNMKFLSFLTPEEVQAIADALVTGGADIIKTTVGLQYKPVMGTRLYVSSHMENIFYDSVSPTADDDIIRLAITENIERKVANLGGPCGMHDPLTYEDKSVCVGPKKTTIKAEMVPTAMALRKGHTTNVCEAILENDKAVATALGRMGLDTSSAPSEENMRSILQLFFPGLDPNAEVTAAMVNLYNSGDSMFSTTDRWRYTLLAPCMSSLGDLL